MAVTKRGNQEVAPHSPEPVSEGFFKEIDVAFLVHELKDPVAVIEAGIRTLLERPEKFGPLTKRQERTLKRSLRNSHKARSILNELLEIGRGEFGCFITGAFRPAEAIFTALTEAVEAHSSDLAEIVSTERSRGQIRDDLQRENIFFQVSPSAADMEMIQDEMKVRHIVGNLIKNALHHRKERIDINVDTALGCLDVAVRDDGPGVPPAFRQSIFQRYTQADTCSGLARDGHGLGLAGARALARCLGGDIQLESGKRRGAIFRLSLPIIQKDCGAGKATI